MKAAKEIGYFLPSHQNEKRLSMDPMHVLLYLVVVGFAWNISFISRMTKGYLPISSRLSMPMLRVEESIDLDI